MGHVAVKPSEHKIQPLLLDESIPPDEEDDELEDELDAATHIKKTVLQRD